jgi:hypothetical protein
MLSKSIKRSHGSLALPHLGKWLDGGVILSIKRKTLKGLFGNTFWDNFLFFFYKKEKALTNNLTHKTLYFHLYITSQPKSQKHRLKSFIKRTLKCLGTLILENMVNLVYYRYD